MLEIVIIAFALWAIFYKKYPYAFIVILCLYASNWFFGVTISDVIVTHNLSDTSNILLLLVVIRLANRTYNNGITIGYLRNGILIFIAFLLCGVFVDVFFNHTPVMSQIKAIRNWFPLILICVAKKIYPNEILKLFKLIVVINLIFSALFIIEYFTNIHITGAIHTSGGARAPVPPPLSLLGFAYLLIVKDRFTVKIRWIFFAILFVNLIVCGSRSLFISYIFVILLYFLKSRFSIKKLIVIILGIIGFLIVFNTDNVLSQRFKDSKEDVESIQQGSTEVSGNLSYRLLLAGERLNYVASNSQYFVFGMGNIEEKNIKKPIFQIGGLDENGNIRQIDTADIAWALCIVRWGIIGIFIYLLFVYVRFIHRYFSLSRQNAYAFAMFVYLVSNLLLTSWTYGDIANMYYWILPIISLSLSNLKNYVNQIAE